LKSLKVGVLGDMKILISILILSLMSVFAAPALSFAQCGPGPGRLQCEYRGRPFGHFCPGLGRGLYGKRMPVLTSQEAKKVIEVYFAGLGEDITTGKTEEGRLFFEVEVLAKDGAVIDKVIVDKRSGRFRSIY
jgi:hypothetical protein